MTYELIVLAFISARMFALLMIIGVLQRQLQYIGLNDDPEYIHTRRVMITLSLAVIISNVVPLTLDMILLFVPNLLNASGLVLIMSSNVAGDVLQALLIRRLYNHSKK